jgi:hypothetical protein
MLNGNQNKQTSRKLLKQTFCETYRLVGGKNDANETRTKQDPASKAMRDNAHAARNKIKSKPQIINKSNQVQTQAKISISYLLISGTDKTRHAARRGVQSNQ